MRLRPFRTRFATFLFIAAFAATSASATSIGKSVAASPTACTVSAKFVTAKSANGKIFWIFDPITTSSSPRCAKLSRTFEIFVPSGSYSEISKSNVYPVSITEPTPGNEIDLRVESVTFKSGDTQWLLSGENDAFRVKR